MLSIRTDVDRPVLGTPSRQTVRGGFEGAPSPESNSPTSIAADLGSKFYGAAKSLFVAEVATAAKVHAASEDSDSSCCSRTDAEDDLYDLLERGFARECFARECLQTPAAAAPDVKGKSKAGLRRFVIDRAGKDTFLLSTDDGKDQESRFMLCAERDEDNFYISPYYEQDSEAHTGPAAVLKLCSSRGQDGYKLFACNRRIGKHVPEDFWPDSVQRHTSDGVGIEDDLLAEIHHSTSLIDGDEDMPIRTLRASIHGAKGGSSEPIRLYTGIPKFRESAQMLVQKFDGNRVRKSSSKNFLMNRVGEKAGKKSGEASIMMQFGKRKSKQYILDHAPALSTMHAFGLALSMCNWLSDEEM
jgi:hypothetical protein